MDILNYVILFSALLGTILITLVMEHKTKQNILGVIVSTISLISSIIFFGLYTHSIIYPMITSEGVAITAIMRTFMLDDLLTTGNITTGFMTSSIFMGCCVAFFAYCIVKYSFANNDSKAYNG